jgi:DNA-binding LacI/PurR family transcriptional regulator
VYSYKKSHPDATIQDIATHFGVSKSTIDRAIHKGKG